MFYTTHKLFVQHNKEQDGYTAKAEMLIAFEYNEQNGAFFTGEHVGPMIYRVDLWITCYMVYCTTSYPYPSLFTRKYYDNAMYMLIWEKNKYGINIYITRDGLVLSKKEENKASFKRAFHLLFRRY